MNKLTIAAGLAIIAASLLAGPAQALPVPNLTAGTTELASVQGVVWVCDPYRCWWQPNYRDNYVAEPRAVDQPFPRWRSWYGTGYDFNSGYPEGSSVRRRWW
jgi:hypothetical protein